MYLYVAIQKVQNMLQHEDIAKIQEMKGKFNNNWISSKYLQEHLNILEFNKIKNKFSLCKAGGFSFETLISILLFLPLTGIKTIHELTKSKNEELNQCGKDAYYRILANQKINWRLFLMLFVKQYLLKDKLFTPSEDNTKCLIFDDTDLAKTGDTIEGISNIYNHVTKTYYLGFKLLVAGYWNGSVFIPIDFSLHRESKKNGYGLTIKQRKRQKKTLRDNRTLAKKRYKELNKKKTDLLVEMFSRVVKRKITVDYILMDSWFTSASLLKRLRDISKSTHIIGMYKYNSKIKVQSQVKTLSQLKKQKTKPKRCRKLNYYYYHYISELDGLKVAIFISKRGKNGTWHTLISTDTSLTFIKTIEVYSIRWSIEVFFKEAKQLFKLGKSQSTNFDVQIAQITITMVQYLLTSIRYRIEAYETIGGLFKEMKQNYIENKLNVRILLIVALIVDILEKMIDLIDVELITKRILTDIESFGVLFNSQNANCQKLEGV